MQVRVRGICDGVRRVVNIALALASSVTLDWLPNLSVHLFPLLPNRDSRGWSEPGQAPGPALAQGRLTGCQPLNGTVHGPWLQSPVCVTGPDTARRLALHVWNLNAYTLSM